MKDQTEELIKETAKKMFFAEGKFHATTQEIADEAKVNRTLINYYFRSRNNLINIIFDEAKMVSHEKSRAIFDRDKDLKEMIADFIDDSLKLRSRNTAGGQTNAPAVIPHTAPILSGTRPRDDRC